MGAIWFLSQGKNLLITAFNRVEKHENGKNLDELWVTEVNGSSRKIAIGEDAKKIENALLDVIWSSQPAIITDGKGFSTNLTPRQTQEVE